MKNQPMESNMRGGGRPAAQAASRTRVGQVIRQYRTAAGMDQAALAARLGFTKAAVGNWELGLTRPDIDTVPRLCRELRIPVTELLGMDAEAALRTEDQALLHAFHRLSRYDQGTVRQLMDRLLFQQDRREQSRLRRSYVALCRYEEAAAAGIGTPMLDDAEAETVYALGGRVPAGADCVIHVNGRSMEPDFRDGSYVYVASGAEVAPGQVGIFLVNGDAFVKEYQPDGLHSRNPRYPVIHTGGDTVVRCFGRVVGTVSEGDIAAPALAAKIEMAFQEDGEDGIDP